MNFQLCQKSIYVTTNLYGKIQTTIKAYYMKNGLKKLWKENKSLVVFISLMLVFRSAVADWSDVPTGSMKPTIVEGDRILINKMAYDIRIPFTHTSLVKLADPQRNDIIIFDSKVSDIRLVKRVIAVPGDVVAMKDNVLSINNRVADYQLTSSKKTLTNNHADEISIERILGDEHYVTRKKIGSPLSNFAPVTVPKDYYLALGDNRDNSADSRVIGFIPRNEIIGRSKMVVLSIDYDNYFLPRNERFLHAL